MKTLGDVKFDMTDLYDDLREGRIELKVASELANIAGKFLKADQLDLAHQVFAHSISKPPLKVANG